MSQDTINGQWPLDLQDDAHSIAIAYFAPIHGEAIALWRSQEGGLAVGIRIHFASCHSRRSSDDGQGSKVDWRKRVQRQLEEEEFPEIADQWLT
jgi:hypothetical protein